MISYQKELLHFKMLHDISPEALEELDVNTRKEAEQKSLVLKTLYPYVTELVIIEHKQHPFSRVYFEGFDGYYKNHEEILSEKLVCLDPLRSLVKRGCKFEQTEHPGFNLLLYAYIRKLGGYQKAIEHLNLDAKGKTVGEFIRGAHEYFDDLDLVQEFMDGEYIFNFGYLREKWIGRNIERTLKNHERGVLFLGRIHGEKIIREQLKDCRYLVEDPFAALCETQ